MADDTPAKAAPTMDRERPLGRKTTQGVAWAFIRAGGTELLFFPASMIVARILTPEEFGVAAAAGFFTILAGRVSELGFNAALIRAKTVTPIHYSTVFVVNLVVGVVTFLTLTAMAPAVASFYRAPATGEILPLAATGFLIVPFGTISAALLSREMRFREMTYVDWWHSFAFAIISVIAAWMGFSYLSMVYGRLGALTVLTITRIAFAPWRPSLRFSREALREVLSFGAGVHAKRLLDYAAKNIDNLVVGRFLGMTSLGFYDKAFSTMDRLQGRLTGGAPGVTFRVFAVIHEEPERFRRAYHKVVMSTTMLAYPAFALLMAVADPFMVVVFGEPWREAVLPLQILCVAGAMKLPNTYASSATQAAGRVWGELWRQVVYVVLIVSSVYALRGWGPTGAATGVLLSTIVMTVLMNVLLTRVTHLRPTDVLTPQLPALICSVCVAATALAAGAAITAIAGPATPFVRLAVQAGAGVLCMAIFVLFAPYAPLRTLVREVSQDLAPPAVKRHAWAQRYWARSA